MIRHFIDLEAYQKSQALYPKVVEFTQSFPREGAQLKDQTCRAANSIHADIAEGFGRSIPEFKHYLTRSFGSCNEIITHLWEAINAKFGREAIGKELIKEYEIIGKQIYRLQENWK